MSNSKSNSKAQLGGLSSFSQYILNSLVQDARNNNDGMHAVVDEFNTKTKSGFKLLLDTSNQDNKNATITIFYKNKPVSNPIKYEKKNDPH